MNHIMCNKKMILSVERKITNFSGCSSYFVKVNLYIIFKNENVPALLKTTRDYSLIIYIVYPLLCRDPVNPQAVLGGLAK